MLWTRRSGGSEISFRWGAGTRKRAGARYLIESAGLEWRGAEWVCERSVCEGRCVCETQYAIFRECARRSLGWTRVGLRAGGLRSGGVDGAVRRERSGGR